MVDLSGSLFACMTLFAASIGPRKVTHIHEAIELMGSVPEEFMIPYLRSILGRKIRLLSIYILAKYQLRAVTLSHIFGGHDANKLRRVRVFSGRCTRAIQLLCLFPCIPLDSLNGMKIFAFGNWEDTALKFSIYVRPDTCGRQSKFFTRGD